MKAKMILLVSLICLCISGSAMGFGTTLRADISGPGTWDDGGNLRIQPNAEFNINIYCNNNDTILPPPFQARTTWSTPFDFTGDIAIEWLDTTLTTNTAYFDSALMVKFVPVEFYNFWDVIRVIYTESWNGILPDVFNFSGIGNTVGYPPGLGELKVISWKAKTSSTGGSICVQPGNMEGITYDWLFDEPIPDLPITCWMVKDQFINNPPVLNEISNQNVDPGGHLHLVLTAIDPDSDTLTYSADPMLEHSALTPLTINTAAYDFYPDSSQAGEHFVLFTVSDGLLTDSQMVRIFVTGPLPDSTTGLLLRSSISGPGVWQQGDTLLISPNEPFFIDLYANNLSTPPNLFSPNRTVWCSPFTFSGNVYVIWGDTASVPQPLFVGFWDMFSRNYMESWDGALPDRYGYVGLAYDWGYPTGLGEIKVLSWGAVIPDTSGTICIEKGDMDNNNYDWYFDEDMFGYPTPQFPTTCWTVKQPSTPPPTGFCGHVHDTSGDPIEAATVEFWINFPRDTLLGITATDPLGQFDCSIAGAANFDVYIYKEGYYPAIIPDNGEPRRKIFDVRLMPVGEVTPTWESVSFYCGENIFLDAPLPIGSVIDAYDPDGVRCGTWYVSETGKYGFMPVYRDDFTTPDIDEGADPGDTISFFIDGMRAIASPTPIWTEFGLPQHVCLTVPYIQTRTILLKKGWNLVSWNVDTEDDQVTTILGSVMDCVEVVLGFQNGGLIYDPELSEFSTLTSMDHLHGYWIKMNCDKLLNIEGYPIPAATPIGLDAGWNLVSYLESMPDSTPHALGSILDNLIVALGFDNGAITYDPNLPEYSTLKIMAPNFGYWVKVNSDDELIYPGIGPKTESGQHLAGIDKAVNDLGIKPSRVWINLYSHRLTMDDKVVPEGAVVTAITPEGKVVGASTVGANGKFGFMSVYGDDPVTKEVDGIKPGEKFYLTVDDIKSSEGFIWSSDGDRLEIKSITGKGTAPVLPKEFSLYQNYPNPFNPATEISFDLPKACDVELEIYNIAGQKVISLISQPMEAGRHVVQWDSRDDNGSRVSSGIYLYRLKAGDFSDTKKMILLK